MERNTSPVIIEFNGLPGCGKTTTTNHLIGMFEDNRFKVARLFDINMNKPLMIVNSLKYKRLKFLFAIISLAATIKPFNKKRIKVALVTYYILLKYSMLPKTKYDVVLVDQGIIQSIISLYHIDSMDTESKRVENTLKYLFDFHKSLTIVNCNSKTNTVFSRIKKRKYNGGRFDQMDEHSRHKNLIKQEISFDKIRNILQKVDFRQFSISTEDSVEKNSEFLYELIMKIRE